MDRCVIEFTVSLELPASGEVYLTRPYEIEKDKQPEKRVYGAREELSSFLADPEWNRGENIEGSLMSPSYLLLFIYF